MIGKELRKGIVQLPIVSSYLDEQQQKVFIDYYLYLYFETNNLRLFYGPQKYA